MKQINSEVLKKGVAKSVNLFLHPLKFLCLFLVLAFSIDGFACEGVGDSVGDAYIAAAPDDPVRNYTEGYARFCQGREGGLDYIGKASDLGHVSASYFMGDHHRTGGDINSNSLPTNQEDYDAAIFYYERAAKDIEETDSYPKRPDGRGVYGAEEKHYMSVRVFLHLNRLYYAGYIRALRNMLKNDVSYTDTIQVLENLKSAADRCLKRPSLSIWRARQKEIANSKQVICQAQKDFTEKALGTEQVPGLEFRRIEVAKHCDGSLKECTAHRAIFQELVQAVQEMNNEINSVPKI